MKFRLLEISKNYAYTDEEIAAFNEADLKTLIEDHVGNLTLRQKLITAWLDKHYGSKLSKLNPALSIIISQINDENIKDNAFITFLDEYTSVAALPDLDVNIALLVDDLIDKGDLDNSSDVRAATYLYDPDTYTESLDDIIYKIKAFTFISEPINRQRFGLPDDIYKELKGKTAADIKSILASYQSKNNSGSSGLKILKDILGKNPTKADIRDYLINLANESGSKLDATKVTAYLDDILSDRFNSDWDDIVNILNSNYKDSKDGSITAKDRLDQKLVGYLRTHASNSGQELDGSQIIASQYGKDTLDEADLENYLLTIGTELNLDGELISELFNSIKNKRLDPKWSALTSILNEKFKDKDDISAKDQLDQKIAAFLTRNTSRSNVKEYSGTQIILASRGKEELTYVILRNYLVKLAKEAGLDPELTKEFFNEIKGNRLDPIWANLVGILNRKYKNSESGELTAKDYFDQDLVKFLSKNLKAKSKSRKKSETDASNIETPTFSATVNNAIDQLVSDGEDKTDVIETFNALRENGVNIDKMSTDKLLDIYRSRKSV